MVDLNGTKVLAPVVPPTSDDVFPTHQALYGKGGYRTVANITARDAIPEERREVGMRVFVIATDKTYICTGVVGNTYEEDSTSVIISTTSTYYVNPATGDDADDGSIGSPWKTLNRAFLFFSEAVISGVTVTLNCAAGTYQEWSTSPLTDTNIAYPGATTVQGGKLLIIGDVRHNCGLTYAHNSCMQVDADTDGFTSGGQANTGRGSLVALTGVLSTGSGSGDSEITVTMTGGTLRAPQFSADGYGVGDIIAITLANAIYFGTIAQITDTSGSFYSMIQIDPTSWTLYDGTPVAEPAIGGINTDGCGIVLLADRVIEAEASTTRSSIIKATGVEADVTMKGFTFDSTPITKPSGFAYLINMSQCEIDIPFTNICFKSRDQVTGEWDVGFRAARSRFSYLNRITMLQGWAAISTNGFAVASAVYTMAAWNAYHGASVNGLDDIFFSQYYVLNPVENGLFVTAAQLVRVQSPYVYSALDSAIKGQLSDRVRVINPRFVDCASGYYCHTVLSMRLAYESADGDSYIKNCPQPFFAEKVPDIDFTGTHVFEVTTGNVAVEIKGGSYAVLPSTLTINNAPAATGTTGIKASEYSAVIAIGITNNADTPIDPLVENQYGNTNAIVRTDADAIYDDSTKEYVQTWNTITADIDYYVDPVGGDDANTGLVGAPWKTLTKASTFLGGKILYDAIVNVYCAAGSYSENAALEYDWRLPVVEARGGSIVNFIFDAREYAGQTLTHEARINSSGASSAPAEGIITITPTSALVIEVVTTLMSTRVAPSISAQGWVDGDETLLQINATIYRGIIDSVVDDDLNYKSTITFKGTGWTDYDGGAISSPDLTALAIGTAERGDGITFVPNRDIVMHDIAGKEQCILVPFDASQYTIQGLTVDYRGRLAAATPFQYAIRDVAKSFNQSYASINADTIGGVRNVLTLVTEAGSTYNYGIGMSAGRLVRNVSAFYGRGGIIGDVGADFVTAVAAMVFKPTLYGILGDRLGIYSSVLHSARWGIIPTKASCFYTRFFANWNRHVFLNYSEYVRMYDCKMYGGDAGIFASETGVVEINTSAESFVIKGVDQPIVADHSAVVLNGKSGAEIEITVPTTKTGIDLARHTTLKNTDYLTLTLETDAIGFNLTEFSNAYIDATSEIKNAGAATGTTGVKASGGSRAILEAGTTNTADTPVEDAVQDKTGNVGAIVRTKAYAAHRTVKVTPDGANQLIAEGIAAAIALTPTATAPVAILADAAEYPESNLTLPSYTHLIGLGGTVILKGSAGQEILSMSANSQVHNVTLKDATGSGGRGIDVTGAGCEIHNCAVHNCEEGICATGAGVLVDIYGVTITSCVRGYYLHTGGKIIINSSIMRSNTTAIQIDHVGSGAELRAFSLDVGGSTTDILVEASADCEVYVDGAILDQSKITLNSLAVAKHTISFIDASSSDLGKVTLGGVRELKPPLYDVYVHPVAGVGDYTTVAAACAAEAAGAVIGVAPGTYTEAANIVLKEGQTVFGLGGFDSVPVKVQLGNYIVDYNAANARVEGIYFTITATSDKAFVDIDANGSVFRDCTLDFTPTGAQKHRGIRFLTSHPSGCLLENVTIIGDALTYRVISAAANVDAAEGRVLDSTFRNIRISGCQTTSTSGEEWLIALNNPDGNVWDIVYHDHTGLTMDTSGGIFHIDNTVAATKGNCYSNVILKNDSGSAEGTAITYSNYWDAHDSWVGSKIYGFKTAFYNDGNEDVTVTNFYCRSQGGTAISLSGKGTIISNGIIHACGGTTALQVGANGVVSGVTFRSSTGTYNINIAGQNCMLSDIRGDKSILSNFDHDDCVLTNVIVDGTIIVDGDDWNISNFMCATLTFNSSGVRSSVSNGQVTGVTTITGDDIKISHCSLTTLTIDAAASGYMFSNVSVSGNTSISGDSGNSSQCKFAGNLTLNSGGDNNKFTDCTLDGTLSDSGSGNQFLTDSYGGFQDNKNAASLPIEVTDTWHALVATAGNTVRRTVFGAGVISAITAAASADGGASTKFTTSTPHGFTVGEPATLIDTTDFDGVRIVSVVNDTTNFECVVAFTETRTGTVRRPATLKVTETQAKGRYRILVDLNAQASVSSKEYDFSVFVNDTEEDGASTRRTFSSTAFGSVIVSGYVTLAKDDFVWLALKNLTDATDITIRGYHLMLEKLD